MGTAERRLEILKYLCRKRHAKMTELANIFGVCVRTIQRDIFEIEVTFHVPIEIRSGKYGGGVYILGNYSFDHMYMCEEELGLLRKIETMVESQLTEQEKAILSTIIKKYSICA